MRASFRPLAGHGAGSYTFLGLRVLLGSGWVGHQRGWLDAARLGHGQLQKKLWEARNKLYAGGVCFMSLWRIFCYL